MIGTAIHQEPRVSAQGLYQGQPCSAWHLWVRVGMLSSTVHTAMGYLLLLWLAIISLQPARTQVDNSWVEEENILVLNQHNFARALQTYKLLLVEFCE